MKLYVISGLGADEKVFEKIKFPKHLEVVYIPWLMPKQQETYESYVERMSEGIDTSESFCLMGYSFGGIVVQDIHRCHSAKKVLILASIKCHKEKPWVGKLLHQFSLIKNLPLSTFKKGSIITSLFIQKFVEKDMQLVDTYFVVQDTHYLRWSLEHIFHWQGEVLPDVIQIMGTKDIAFPIENSTPDYRIEGGSHFFPVTHAQELTAVLNDVFGEM